MSQQTEARLNTAPIYYDEKYFKWQAPLGEFGGWANQTKFEEHITANKTVLDFGCGGGFLLKNMPCGKRVGVELNPVAADTAKTNGIEVYRTVEEVPDGYVDVVISNNALEHTLHPLQELKALHKKLRVGGRIVFIVPCESISYAYQPNDHNRHLYSWSPMCIGNLFTEAGFSVIEATSYIHKWPPGYRFIAKICGRRLFDMACRLYGRIERTWFQVRVVAEKRC
jgi:2-polyprenyl-3-methyl-5-hydroxy-6-metoxy-1,4-benzoquinol methylase